MLNINILPQELKNSLKRIKLYKFIQRISSLLFFLTIILSAIIFLSRIILELQANATSNNLSIQKTQTSSGELKDILTEVEQVKQIQADQVNWTKNLENIISSINPNISLSSMQLNKDSNELTLKGIAKTRQDLLDFKKLLEESQDFSNLNFPIKNLSDRENINFDAKMNIKFL